MPSAKNSDTATPTITDEAILARLENKAAHYLGRYATTEMRLADTLHRFARRKLSQVEPERMAALITRKVRDCVARGFVDDAAYAVAKTASLRRSGASRAGVSRKLAAAGCSAEVIADALQAHEQQAGRAEEARHVDGAHDGRDIAEKTAALIYARKRRLGVFADPARRTEGWEQRHLGSLARAGFAYATARFVLDFASRAEAEEWLAGRGRG